MQVAEKKNIAQEEVRNLRFRMDDNIPAGLDRLDLILEADAKRRAERNVIAEIKERLNNIDAMMAYIINELDDPDVDDRYANVDHLNDDPYADIEIPPPEGWDPDFEPDLPALPNGLIDNREQWRDINRYQNYEVSHHGRVRNKTTGRILRLQPNGTGVPACGPIFERCPVADLRSQAHRRGMAAESRRET